MHLPQTVTYCIQALEAAGYQAYAVGGCVRDSLLGLLPADYDLCTDATPAQICDVFSAHQLLHHGQKHGTVGVVLENRVYEITTFRTEGGYDDRRHPSWVAFVSSVEEDLARRDFTVNAMAYNPRSGYVDPFGGMADLENKVLRAVGDPRKRFLEDALRILRGARFSARFQLTPEKATLEAMEVLAPSLRQLASERVFDELCKLLLCVHTQDLLTFAPILFQAIPELAPTAGFQQHNPHHSHDVFTHIAYVTEAVPPVLSLRWAALLHDIGKPATFSQDPQGIGHFYGHAQVSAQTADTILRRLKAPTALRQQVTELIRLHMTPLEPAKKLLRRRLSKLGAERLELLLLLQEADQGHCSGSTADSIAQIRRLLAQILEEPLCLGLKDLAVNGSDLLRIGFVPGPSVGSCLNTLLRQVQDEQIPNEKEALLSAAMMRLSVQQEENP